MSASRGRRRWRAFATAGSDLVLVAAVGWLTLLLIKDGADGVASLASVWRARVGAMSGCACPTDESIAHATAEEPAIVLDPT
jgi:hypothetical protein